MMNREGQLDEDTYDSHDWVIKFDLLNNSCQNKILYKILNLIVSCVLFSR